MPVAGVEDKMFDGFIVRFCHGMLPIFIQVSRTW
jgi:hypothetical protein